MGNAKWLSKQDIVHLIFSCNPQVVLYDKTCVYFSAPKFTKDHEWVSLSGKTATIGITDYAQVNIPE